MKFTILTNAMPGTVVGKTAILIDGKLEKETVGAYQLLDAETVDTNLAGLKQLVEQSTPQQHLTSGTMQGLLSTRLAPEGNSPGRNNATLKHVPEPGLFCADSDNAEGVNVWGEITAACPALAGHARLECSSTGANIAHKGKLLTGETGLHTFLHAADATDIPRALHVLHKRLILSGHARYRVSATGAILERTMVDTVMAVPSQAIYLRPHLAGDLEQKKRIQLIPGNEIVDTRLCIPDLSSEEEEQFRRMDAAARAALQAEAAAKAAAYDEERGKALPGGAAEARAARESSRLPVGWPVVLSDGSTVTVGAILADPKAYQGKTCRDPMEPTYGSKTVAIIYSDQPAPMIHSMAHGRRVFHLGEPDLEGMFKPVQPAAPDDGPQEIVTQYIRVPFPIACLPAIASAACMDVQYDTQAPMALVAGSAIAAMSGASMGHVSAVRSPTLKGPCSAVILAIAAASERKTSVDARFAVPFNNYEIEAGRKYARALELYARTHGGYEARLAALEKALRDALQAEANSPPLPNDKLPSTAIVKRIEEFHASNKEPVKPVLARMMYKNATSEKLYQAFGNYPLMVVMADEGGTFVGSKAMDKESLMATASLINEAWSGSIIRKDTKGDADMCANPRITMHLMVQPGVFKTLLGANGGQARDIGLISRFLMCEPESTKGSRFISGRETAGTFGIDLFNQRIAELLAQPVTVSSTEGLITREMPMDAGAHALWAKFHDKIEANMGQAGIYEGVSDVAGKIAENAARLATMFSFVEGRLTVNEGTMMNACTVAEWYLNESLMLLGLGSQDQVVQDAVAVESWIIKTCLETGKDFVTLRDLTKGVCRRLRGNKGDAPRDRDLALHKLMTCNRLRYVVGEKNSVHLMPLPDLLAKARATLI